MSEAQDRAEGEDEGAERFFSVKQSDKKDSVGSRSVAHSDASDEDQEHKGCLTLRILQFLLPCLRNKNVWEQSQGDVFKSHDAEETKYPRTLRILESRVFDTIFVASCLLSIYLYLFSLGFILESRLLWGIMHLVNAVYALGLFSQWLQILIKSKYAKTNHGYTTRDILYTLASVFPADLIVLVIYTLNDEDDNEDNEIVNPIATWMIYVSRLNYFLRIRSILQYFSKWENHLVIGDFAMFALRTILYTSFLLHFLACIWHRLACSPFRLRHFLMTPDEATTDVCFQNTWIFTLKQNNAHPLLDHPDWHVLVTHYFVAVYWSIIAGFRLGGGDIRTTLTQPGEVAFVVFTEITAWIYVLVHINGTLASLFIEKDTEKEHFLTRCFAIRHFLKFSEVARSVHDEVNRFYSYLWEKSKGILNVDLIDVMHPAMKSEVFYDVNKFVMDQLPMLKGLDTPFLMSLSVHTTHKFFLSGEVLFRKNETADAMYYLVKGHLDILSGDEKHVIATIRSGSIIGEIHLLQPYPHTSTVRCGSNCDILVLTRAHFRNVLNAYPQFITVLEQRLEIRLEQSGLLLALCEKHNTYHKPFKALCENSEAANRLSNDSNPNDRYSFENVAKILGGVPTTASGADNTKKTRSTDEDIDGLDLSRDLAQKLKLGTGGTGASSIGAATAIRQDQQKYFDQVLAEACLALETDVARAGSLATDLNIPRPPLIVAAPENNASLALLGFHHHHHGGESASTEGNMIVHCFKYLSESSKSGGGTCNFLWDLLVCFCALSVFWYYPYQFAFRGEEYPLTDYIFHVTDIIFCLDCIYDMMQVVVTPKKTLESFKEIFVYRLKTVYFYIRVISFIPLEYIFAVPFGVGRDSPSPYFYLFKFNRLIQIHLVFPFLNNAEGHLYSISPVMMELAKLVLGIFYVSHMATVSYKFLLRDLNGLDLDPYRKSFYRALVVISTTGYGDIRSSTNLEVVVEVFGLFIGIFTMIYLQAKVTARLVNRERRRTRFHRLFYTLKAFMVQRRFPKSLRSRVSEYYSLQWAAHQGTLIPWEQQVLWDAPKSLIFKVAYCLGHKYISRIPLFMNCPVYLQTEFSLVFNHYIIPPGEVILYPDELVRDLYVITKGYVDVIHKQKVVGIFGEGRYFGLSGLLHGVNTDFLFRSRTHCQIYCLPYENFIKVAKSNANFLQEYLLLRSGQQEVPSRSKTAIKSKGNLMGEPSISSHAYISSEYVKLPYPTQEFMDNLVESSPPFEAPPTLTALNDTKDPSPQPATFHNQQPDYFPGNFYFLPHGTPLKVWTTFRVICAILATILAPAQLVFPIRPWTSFTLTLALDIVAWVDIVVSMRCAYLGNKNQMITNSKKMAIRYLKSSFVLDFLGSFPADMLFFFALVNKPMFDNHYHLISFLRLNRMLQGCNIIMVKNVLEKTMFSSLSFIMLLEMVPIMFLFMNVTTCIAILSVCQYSKTGQVTKCGDADAWILSGLRNLAHISNVENLKDIFSSYVVGMYWVTISIFCVGFGGVDIGDNMSNQLISICIVMTGIMTVTYVGGKLTSCISGQKREMIVLQEKMTLMDEYLEQHRVSKNCRLRVLEVYLNSWDKSQCVSSAKMFPALTPTLNADVMKQLYGPALKTSPLFKDLDGPGLRLLARSLKEVFYPEGEFLMKFGDLCDDVYFIANGAVVCYNVRGDIMCQLGGGSLIGEISAFFNIHRLYTAITVMDVTAFVFKKTVFLEFLDQYPKIKTIVEACSVKHHKEAMAGSKKFGSLDFDVMLTYTNEKGEHVPHQDEIFAKPPIVGIQSLRKTLALTAISSADVRKQPSIKFDGDDPTRNIFTEDVMKNSEEFVKSTAERWTGVVLTFGRRARDEMGLVHVYQELGKVTLFNFCIHPASAVCGWTSFFLVLTTMSCGLTSYEIAFSSRHRVTETTWIATIRHMLEVFFIVRIIGNFHLGYYDETNTLITNAKLIAKRYVQRVDGLWLDLVTTLPFSFLEYAVPGLKGEYLRSVQLLRVCLFVRYLRETDNTLKTKASLVKVFKITILLCFIFHFWACAWYLIACTDKCTTGSWMQEVLNAFDKNRPRGPSGQPMPAFDDDSVPTATRYLLSLYYVTNALTYTGFTDITARTQSELCLTIAMIFGTLFLIGYLVGEMVQTLASQVATKIHYQHKLAILEAHFVTLGISQQKIHEVRHYFRLLWCRCRGMRFYNLMEELPYTLRADTAMEIYGPNLKSSRILGRLDENLIRQICAKIRHEIYFPGSHIVRAGDICSSMYFIKKGEVVILDGNSNLELCVEILYENECFGEVKILLSKEQYRFSYVARLESEVGVLHKEDLESVLKNHPKIHEELKDKANRVKARRQSLKEDEQKDKIGGLHGVGSSMSIRSGASRT